MSFTSLSFRLDDLQLRQQQLGERHRGTVDVEPIERYRVAHLELADEHVELALVQHVVGDEPACTPTRLLNRSFDT